MLKELWPVHENESPLPNLFSVQSPGRFPTWICKPYFLLGSLIWGTVGVPNLGACSMSKSLSKAWVWSQVWWFSGLVPVLGSNPLVYTDENPASTLPLSLTWGANGLSVGLDPGLACCCALKKCLGMFFDRLLNIKFMGFGCSWIFFCYCRVS
jgi:hypothetical protein